MANKYEFDFNTNVKKVFLSVDKEKNLTKLSSNFLKSESNNNEIVTVSGVLDRKNRNSVHQDVEEALNSLLWEPYEYRNDGGNNLNGFDSLVLNNGVDGYEVAEMEMESPSDLDLLVNNLGELGARLNQSESVYETRDQCTERGSCVRSTVFGRFSCDDAAAVSVKMRVEIQNLSSVNVVGLPVPNHSRNISEPYRGSGGGNQHPILPVQHVRNISEPAHLTLTQQRPRNRMNSLNNNNNNNNNISNVNVNYYRAVPVNVVSSVPTIQCFNGDTNNVSSVNILPIPFTSSGHSATTTTTSSTQVIVHSVPSSTPPSQSPSAIPERTFTSTEAQTDDTASVSREQRRRERRERRHQRRLNHANHRHQSNNPTNTTATSTTTVTSTTETSTQLDLPDLLGTLPPPPYPPNPQHPQQNSFNNLVPNNLVPLVPNPVVTFHPHQVPLVQSNAPPPVSVPVPVPSGTGFRFPFPATGFRRSRYSEEPPKSCCGLLAWRPGSLRWFIALIALVAVCCVLVGTALGAMRPAGRDHLTVSLLMIGVGIILVTVSGVAWRLTSHDSSNCRTMLGLGSSESVEVCTRRFVPRLPPTYGRPHHPYAAMMYPEFQYRPPPPSYQASMQEYRLRLLLLDRGNSQIQSNPQTAASPPPTYRSHSGSLLRVPLTNRRETGHSEYSHYSSHPPSYRSQTSSSRPPTIITNGIIHHSREQSLSESNNDGSIVNVVNILTPSTEDIDSLKLEPSEDTDITGEMSTEIVGQLVGSPMKVLLGGGRSDSDKEGNLVTIVQTNDQSPVIVTVSGGSNSEGVQTVQIGELSNEMEILAHL